MLGIPARLAGCPEVVLCSPPRKNGGIDPAVLVAARLCGIHRVLKLGGAQAIAAMAFGTTSVPRCDKVRSEEHTSELQSLMRISYAVFCLKKKKTTTHNIEYEQANTNQNE